MNPIDLNDPRLTAFALGELSEPERLAVEQWLEESAEARAALVEIQETIDLVKVELASEPVPTLTMSQRSAIEAQIAGAPSTVASQGVTVTTVRSEDRPSLTWRWLSLALTAAALVGIALVLPKSTRHEGLSGPLAKNDGEARISELAMNDPQARALAESEAVVTVDESKPLSELVDDYNKAYRARDFATSAAIAKRAKQIDPENQVVVEMELKATFATRNDSNRALVATKEEATWNSLDEQSSDKRREMSRGVAVADAERQKHSLKINIASAPQADAKALNETGRSVDATRRMKADVAVDAPLESLTSKTSPAGGGGLGGGAPASQAPLVKGANVTSTVSPAKNDTYDRLQAGTDKAPASSPTAGKRMEDEAKSRAGQPRDYAVKSEGLAAPSSDDSVRASGTPAGTKPATSVSQKRVLFAPEPDDRKRPTPKIPGTPKTEAEVAKLMRERTELRATPALEQREAKNEAESRTVALRDSERKKVDESNYRYLPVKESQDQVRNAEAYEAITENDFLVPQDAPLSTFSIDVDSASYANMRRFLSMGQLPPPNAIRVEELINYFSYQYPQPADGKPFSVLADAAPCPWNKDHYVARIGLKARDIDKTKRPATNLVFLIDVSGSMGTPNKLPLVKRGLSLLVEEMTENDRISIVTYAGDAGLKLEPTTGNEQARITTVIDGLNAGGSTNGAAGINLAYEQALRHFNKDSANRVILCTDGDFNVGVSSDDELVKLIQAQAKSGVFLSIFGFGMGNLKDSKLEKLADKGNGHYGYIDDLNEARKVFSEELVGTLYTVAKDVKLQVEFNPLTVGAYRLIGYENRTLAAQDFNDDTKDAGEIGAGHTVTALYEIVPVGKWPKPSNVDPLKYASADKAIDEKRKLDRKEPAAKVPADVADDLFTVKLRYKLPDAETSVKTIDYVVDDIAGKKIVPNGDLMWAASVANFGMQLRHSKHAGQWKLEDIAETASGLCDGDKSGRRSEFVDLVKRATSLRRE